MIMFPIQMRGKIFWEREREKEEWVSECVWEWWRNIMREKDRDTMRQTYRQTVRKRLRENLNI